MTTRQEVVQEARGWLGTPYHHQGRVKGAGVDCAMLLIEVFRARGLIPDIDPKPYPPDWHLHRDEERYLGWVKRYARLVEVPQPGDIALFQFGRCVSHGAIVIEWPVVIHSYLRDGCILADATETPLGGRLRGFYSIFKDQA
jgi:NlpC/P60 family putative phage cell wall peptidase